MRQPRMPHAIALVERHTIGIILTVVISGKGLHGLFFLCCCEDLGLALTAKLRPDRPQASKEVNHSQMFL